jgi:hypothetical protein
VPLSNAQVSNLNAAITGYAFPAVYFDFARNTPVAAANMAAVEAHIHNQLTSPNQQSVLHGLANVLYWGYAQIGYRNVRVHNFLAGANAAHASAFGRLRNGGAVPTLHQLKGIRIPQFSGISFISKILAFLDPINYCVLDQQLARIANGNGGKALNQLVQGPQLRVTANNQRAYDAWRKECATISSVYFRGVYRVIDIERGFFHLVQTGQLQLAQKIYADA